MSSESSGSASDSDDDRVVEGCGSPRMQRKKKLKKIFRKIERRDSTASHRPLDELLYDDNLPEVKNSTKFSFVSFKVLSREMSQGFPRVPTAGQNDRLLGLWWPATLAEGSLLSPILFKF